MVNFQRSLQILNSGFIFPSRFAQYEEALEKPHDHSKGDGIQNGHLRGALFIHRNLIHADSPIDQENSNDSP